MVFCDDKPPPPPTTTMEVPPQRSASLNGNSDRSFFFGGGRGAGRAGRRGIDFFVQKLNPMHVLRFRKLTRKIAVEISLRNISV